MSKLAKNILKKTSGSTISDIVPNLIKINFSKNLQSSKAIEKFFGENLTTILKRNLADSLNDPTYITKQLENSIKANKNSLLTGEPGKELFDNIIKDFTQKNPALLRMQILRNPDNFSTLLREAINTEFDTAIKNGLLKSSDDIAKSLKKYISSPNSQNIIYDFLENLPDQSFGKTQSDVFSDILANRNNNNIDDIASSMTKLQAFTTTFKNVVIKTIILGGLSFTGLGLAKIISDKVRDREDFGKNITRILKDGNKTNSLIVEYRPPIDWCCNDIIKILEIDPSIVSPSINGMEFIPEVVPSDNPSYGRLRLSPTNQHITINETIESGSYGEMKCIYGVYKLIDCIVVQERDQCVYDGITYYNCENTVCKILDGDSDCKLSPNRYESACTNNKKKISYEIVNQATRNGKTCLTVAGEIGNFPWTVDYVDNEVYYEETCTTTNQNNCVINMNSMNVSNCLSNNIRQITYDIDKLGVTGGKSCTQVAQELLGFTNWQEDTVNRKVFRTEACILNPVDCTIGNQNIATCRADNTRIVSYPIITLPVSTGKTCSQVASEKSENVGQNYSWTMDTSDLQNKKLFRTEACLNPVDCTIGNQNIDTCRADNTRIVSYPIITLPVSTGKTCSRVASEKSENVGQNYSWTMDTSDLQNKKVFRTEPCLSPVDCSIGNESIDTCRNDNTRIVSYPIITLPVSTGKTCSRVASEKSENVGQNYSWTIDTSDPQNKKVFRTEACENTGVKTNVDCVLSETQVTGVCQNNKKKISYEIITPSSGNGISCQYIASIRQGDTQSNWSIEMVDGKKTIYKLQDCGLDAVGKGTTTEENTILDKIKSNKLLSISIFVILSILLIYLFLL
jgi:hypothetical protein